MDYKTLWKGDYLSVISPKDHPYEAVLDQNCVWVFPITQDGLIGVRKEYCPPYFVDDETNEKQYYTIVSGGIEKDEKPVDAALRELREEAGVIPFEDIQIKEVFAHKPPLKAIASRNWCYIVEIGHLEKEEPKGDGTYNETQSETIWVSLEELEELKEKENSDFLIFSAYYILKNYFENIRTNSEPTDSVEAIEVFPDEDEYPLPEERILLEEYGGPKMQDLFGDAGDDIADIVVGLEGLFSADTTEKRDEASQNLSDTLKRIQDDNENGYTQSGLQNWRDVLIKDENE